MPHTYPQPTITVSAEDAFTLVLGLVRYSLGRMTYIVGDACRITRQMAPHLRLNDLAILIRDIRGQEKFGYGMEMDRREWMDLLAWLEGHAEGRGLAVTRTARG